MHPMLIGLLAGTGLGALKHGEEKKAAKADRKVQATKARFSPWTGMMPSDVRDPSLMGNMMTGATGGLMMGQAFSDRGLLEGLLNPKEAATAAPVMPNVDNAVGPPGNTFNKFNWQYGGPHQNQQMALTPWGGPQYG